MKHTLTFLLLSVLLLGLTGCRLNRMEPKEAHDFLNGIVEDIGDSQITADETLMGTRTLMDDDSYVGEYTAQCDDVTCRDVVFGGASIDTRVLHLSGHIDTTSGAARIRIRMNDETIELKPDADGYFETALKFTSGGNYIMVIYEDFGGTVEMTCAYVEE